MACVCHPYFNTMELWTFDPNVHLSSQDTTFCLITSLLAPSCAQHVCLLPFDPFVSIFFACFLSLCLSSLLLSWLVYWLVSMFIACTCMERGHDLLGATKEGKDASMKAQAQKGQSSIDQRPSLLEQLYLSTPLSQPLLQSIVLGLSSVYHSQATFLGYGNV